MSNKREFAAADMAIVKRSRSGDDELAAVEPQSKAIVRSSEGAIIATVRVMLLARCVPWRRDAQRRPRERLPVALGGAGREHDLAVVAVGFFSTHAHVLAERAPHQFVAGSNCDADGTRRNACLVLSLRAAALTMPRTGQRNVAGVCSRWSRTSVWLV